MGDPIGEILGVCNWARFFTFISIRLPYLRFSFLSSDVDSNSDGEGRDTDRMPGTTSRR